MKYNISKAKKSNKIFPFYNGLSADIIFWPIISTLFLTTIKEINASQINSIISISILLSIFGCFFIIKLTNSIGKLNMIKIGNLFAILAIIIFILSRNYYQILIGYTLYQYSIILKSVDLVLLRNNLKFIGIEKDFFSYSSKGSLVYSLLSLTAAITSGFLFNINANLPLYVSLVFAIISFIMSHMLYEIPYLNKKSVDTKINFKFSSIIIIAFIIYMLFAGLNSVGQVNTKLLLQYEMALFLTSKKVVTTLAIIVFISRVARVISNVFSPKIYNKLKNKVIVISSMLLTFALSIILIGDFVGKGYLGVIIISFGFILLLMLKDPVENLLKDLLLSKSASKYHEKIMIYLMILRKTSEFLLGMIISVILLNFTLKYALLFMLLISIFMIIIVLRLYKLLKN